MTATQLIGRKRKHPDVTLSKKSFFDALPCDVLTVVIRHISSRPYIDKWQEYLNPAHVLILLKSGDTLEKATRDEVTYLGQIHCGVDAVRDKMEGAVFPELANGLNSLKLRWDPDKKLPRYSLFDRNLIRLRSLVIDSCNWKLGPRNFPFDTVLRTCGGTLRSLALYLPAFCGLNEIAPIAYHCRRLEGLSISTHGFNEPVILPLWPAVGKNLNFLLLRTQNVTLSEQFIDVIANYCPKLVGTTLDHPRQISLCKQIGSQLKVIDMTHSKYIPKAEELTDILRACPNAKVRACLKPFHYVEETLIALSKCLSFLSLTYGDSLRVLDFPMLVEANLQIIDDDTSCIESFFIIPRLSLRKLTLIRIKSEHLLSIVAKSATRLHSLQIETDVILNSCDTLLRANTHLRKFLLSYKSVVEIECFIASLLRSVQNCNKLLEFQVTGLDEKKVSTVIDNACVPLRNRQLVVDIGGVRYLPA